MTPTESDIAAEIAWTQVREIQDVWGCPLRIACHGHGPTTVQLISSSGRTIIVIEWDDLDPVTSADSFKALSCWLARCRGLA